MSASSKTTNYKLPVFSGTDYPSFINDFNPAFEKIDTTMKQNADGIQTASAAATNANQAAQTAQAAATRAQEAADNVVALLTAMGITEEGQAIAFKNKVDNAVPKYNVLASYFERND